MHVIGERGLKITRQFFDAEQLVLEACSGFIKDCSFTNGATSLICRGPSTERRSIYTQIDGGAVLVTGHSRLTFRHCIFRHNSSAMCGGAVSLQAEPGSVITFEDCEFEDNKADDTGPAIDVLTSGMSVAIRNCVFRRNRSTGRLTSIQIGQISIFPDNVVELVRCTFEDNEADVDYHGKVKLLTDANYKITDTTGNHNTRQLQKVAANMLAYLTHPTYYPWV